MGNISGADSQVHKTARKFYTSFSNWDTYRTQTALIAMLAPEETSDIVMSHYLFAEQSGGGFPRWVLANIETGVMQGDPTPILVGQCVCVLELATMILELYCGLCVMEQKCRGLIPKVF